MIKSDMEFASVNFHIGIIPQLPLERSKKLKRLKQAIVDGTYQINSRKLANKLVKLIILGGAAPGSDL